MSYRLSEPTGTLTIESTGEGKTGFILQGTNITSGAAVLTVTTTRSLSVFTAADVNKAIIVVGAGVNGADLYTTILSFTSGTSVTLANNAGGTVTNKSAFWYPVGQNDTTAIQSAINATTDGNSTVYLPAGVYVISSTLTSAPYLKKFKGDGFNQTYIVTSSLAFTGDMLAFNSVGRGLTVSDIGLKHVGLSTAASSAVITAWQVTGGNTAIFTATNSYVAGQLVAISGFVGNGAPLNDSFITVSATGLTGSSFRGALTATNGSGTDTGVAHLDYNCLSFSITTVNTLIYANIDRVQMINAPGDGLKMASCVVSKVTQCVALSNNGHGFAVYNAANVGATSTTFDTCYANGNQQAGYYLHSIVYGTLTSCAADSNGTSYYLYSAKSISLNGCGSEATLNKNAAYPGYHFYMHGGQGNVLTSCYTSSNSGIANTAGTFLVFDNTASQSSAYNMNFAGSSNLPTNAFTIASGCSDITIYEPYFSTIASTAWTDAGTNSTIFIDGTFQSQTGFNNTVFFANTATPIINQNSIANSDGARMQIQAQGTSVDGYIGGELRLQGGTGFQSGTNSRGGDITLKSGSTAPTSLTTPDGYINFNLGNLGNFARWMNNGPTSLNSNVSTVALEFVKDNVTTPEIRIETTSTRTTATSLSIKSQSTTATGTNTNGGALNITAGSPSGVASGTNTGGGLNIRAGSASGAATINQGGNLTLRAGDGSGTGAANGTVRIIDPVTGANVIQFTANASGSALITIVPTSTSFTISQNSTATANGATLQITAQGATGDGFIGGTLGLSAGNSTGTTSAAGGAVNISTGSGIAGGVPGGINIRPGGITSMQITNTANGAASGATPQGATTFSFSNSTTTCSILQNSTNANDGYTLTLQSQNTNKATGTVVGGPLNLTAGSATGASTTNTGGNVVISSGVASGAGTNTNGVVQLQSGGTTVLTAGGAGLQNGASGSISLAGGAVTVTLSAAQYKFPYLVFGGTLTGAVSIVFPGTQGGTWIIDLTGTTGMSVTNTVTFKVGANAWSTVPTANTNLYLLTTNGTKPYVTTLTA